MKNIILIMSAVLFTVGGFAQDKKEPIKRPQDQANEEWVRDYEGGEKPTVKENQAIDYIIRVVPAYGFLPIIEIDGIEIYRGEFQKYPADALAKCLSNAP